MKPILLHGSCADWLANLPSQSVDAIVTDPPYGLSFMGKGWDYDVPGVDIWREVFRVLKPGAHLLSFFGTRTYHRGVIPIEDAGFEIRDQIGWAYGSGFPKSHNLDDDWKGWGTALKPAWEPIVVARKPLVGTVADNVAQFGTGALNIDGCRVEGDARPARTNAKSASGLTGMGGANTYGSYAVRGSIAIGETTEGRWPANLIHDGSPEVLACFPDAPGQIAKSSSSSEKRENQNTYSEMRRGSGGVSPRGDEGSAARFFYCPKASKKDRDEGLAAFTPTTTTDGRAVSIDNPYLRGETTRKNHHPTVKPTELMRYLCRLVTPPGGTVLDPFMGSGSTGKAALLEGFQFIGIERDLEYLQIAEARIEHARVQMLPAVQEYDFG